MSAGSLATDPIFHVRTKHLEIDLHFVRDQVLQQDLEVRYMLSCDQLANCLNKALAITRHQYLRSKLSVIGSPFCLRGVVRKDTKIHASTLTYQHSTMPCPFYN